MGTLSLDTHGAASPTAAASAPELIQFSDRLHVEPYKTLSDRVERWAALRGYRYRVESERGLPTYSVYWEKVRMGLEALERGSEWVLWVDDDGPGREGSGSSPAARSCRPRTNATPRAPPAGCSLPERSSAPSCRCSRASQPGAHARSRRAAQPRKLTAAQPRKPAPSPLSASSSPAPLGPRAASLGPRLPRPPTRPRSSSRRARGQRGTARAAALDMAKAFTAATLKALVCSSDAALYSILLNNQDGAQ